jgi:predicted Rossmann-fold nucleotide-binding protein
MSEFVEGFTFLARVQRSVTFFGSARLPSTHPYYQVARQLGQRLAREGYTIVTGGGPASCRRATRACDADSDSVGLKQLSHEQHQMSAAL